jgi:hypothetical protein
MYSGEVPTSPTLELGSITVFPSWGASAAVDTRQKKPRTTYHKPDLKTGRKIRPRCRKQRELQRDCNNGQQTGFLENPVSSGLLKNRTYQSLSRRLMERDFSARSSREKFLFSPATLRAART